jgi:tripartite ATP-independent transporter DctP family solute receptor
MKKHFKLLFLVLCLILLVGSVTVWSGPSGANSPSVESFQPIVIKAATVGKDGDEQYMSAYAGMKAAYKYIEEKTDGKIKVEIYYGGTLGTTAADVIGGCQNGAFEMFIFSHGNWGEYTDAFFPFNIPYLFTSQAQVSAFLESEGMPIIKDQIMKDVGLRLLGVPEYGFRHMTSNKGIIKSPSDMKGLKLRTMTDPYQIAAMSTLGASPTPIAWAETFSALQQGLVDAQENPLVNLYTAKLFEVQKYLTLTRHNTTVAPICVNENFYQSLPDEYKKVFDEAGKISESVAREVLPGIENELVEMLQGPDCGMIFYDPTEAELQVFQDTVKSSWQVIEKDVGEDRFNNIMKIIEALDPTPYQ